MKKEWQKNVLFGIGVVTVYLMYRYIDRSSLIAFIKSVLPGDTGGLLVGIVLGDKTAISKYWYQIFLEAGVIHIVVASGSNLSIISKLAIEQVAKLIGRKRAIVFGLLIICFYISLVGFEAPVARASIILFIYYWGQFLGRKFNIISALVLTLFVLVLVDMGIVLSVSFWMSLLAFVAVVSFETVYKKRGVMALVYINIWISLWLWPIASVVFGKINIMSMIVNPLVLFGVEYVYILGILSIIMLPVSRLIAGGVLMLTIPFLKYFLGICERMAGLGVANWQFSFNWLMVVGWYMVLLSLVLKKKLKFIQK